RHHHHHAAKTTSAGSFIAFAPAPTPPAYRAPRRRGKEAPAPPSRNPRMRKPYTTCWWAVFSFSHQVWALIFQQLGLLQLMPEPSATRFPGWWRKSIAAVPKDVRNGLNSLIILVAWEVWKHCNACVFDNVRPNIQEVLRSVNTEGGLWCLAGASKLQELVLRSLAPGA
uniref:Uncharacterized protein n=1 Tax=Setaria italica TaxID=4555 RepID=K3Y307_SETIT